VSVSGWSPGVLNHFWVSRNSGAVPRLGSPFASASSVDWLAPAAATCSLLEEPSQEEEPLAG